MISLVTSPLCLSTRRGPLAIAPSSSRWPPPPTRSSTSLGASARTPAGADPTRDADDVLPGPRPLGRVHLVRTPGRATGPIDQPLEAVLFAPGQPRMQRPPRDTHAAATSDTCRPSPITASTALYRCSATLISFWKRASRISRRGCQASPETVTSIRRPRTSSIRGSHTPAKRVVPPARFELATPALGERCSIP
jgi:hypothetical protein